LATYGDRTDQLIVFEHRDRKNGPIAREFNASNDEGMALDVRRYRRDVGDVGHLFRDRDKPKGCVRGWLEQRVARARRSIGGR
jgi:hypothetical protein